MTKARIGGMIGCRALLEKHIDKLPKTSGTLEEVCETDEAFRMRRVKKVIDQMLEDGEMIVEWKVLRRAGIREEYKKVFLEYMSNYESIE